MVLDVCGLGCLQAASASVSSALASQQEALDSAMHQLARPPSATPTVTAPNMQQPPAKLPTAPPLHAPPPPAPLITPRATSTPTTAMPPPRPAHATGVPARPLDVTAVTAGGEGAVTAVTAGSSQQAPSGYAGLRDLAVGHKTE